jgi:hypothetical protein
MVPGAADVPRRRAMAKRLVLDYTAGVTLDFSALRWVFAAALVQLAPAGCLLEITPQVSCGDGHVDFTAGEMCEPGLPETWADACQEAGFEGVVGGACDPNTCTLVTSVELCPTCGDDVINAEGEECDGSVNGATCPSKNGFVTCTNCRLDYSACDPCGDGHHDVEAGEECDPNVSIPCQDDGDCSDNEVCDPLTETCVEQGGVAPVISCGSLDVFAVGPFEAEMYESGILGPHACTQECTWDRTDCGFCGNGELEPAYQDRGPTGQYVDVPEEVCETEIFDQLVAQEFCWEHCSGEATTSTYGCRFDCADDCRSLELPENVPPNPPIGHPDLACCLAQGSSCAGEPEYPCCWSLENPDSGDGCLPVFDVEPPNPVIDYRCAGGG